PNGVAAPAPGAAGWFGIVARDIPAIVGYPLVNPPPDSRVPVARRGTASDWEWAFPSIGSLSSTMARSGQPPWLTAPAPCSPWVHQHAPSIFTGVKLTRSPSWSTCSAGTG